MAAEPRTSGRTGIRMEIVAIPACISLILIASASVSMARRALQHYCEVNYHRVSATCTLVQIGMAIPVGVVTVVVKLQIRPGEDDIDFAGYGVALLLIMLAPVVGVAVWIVGRALELTRRSRHPTACSFCGYDLRGACSTTCPECNRQVRLP